MECLQVQPCFPRGSSVCGVFILKMNIQPGSGAGTVKIFLETGEPLPAISAWEEFKP